MKRLPPIIRSLAFAFSSAGRATQSGFLVIFFLIAASLPGCATAKPSVAPASQGGFPFFPLTPSSAEARYKFLSFFFDGVPKPGAKKTVTGTEKEKEGGAAEVEAPVGSVHGPYAARMCYGCHDTSTNALVLPVRELCLKCHVFKMNKKYIHGPLLAGGCIVCHDPHSSSNRFLLVSRGRNFCLYCHSEKDIARNKAHTDMEAPCISCHDAHMSDKRYMLR